MPAWWPMSGLDLIPEAETALRIGKTILEKYYGEELIRRYEPYTATLHDSEWWLSGGGDRTPGQRGGGQPELSIARHDGRVIRIALSR
jgi:NTF2 fold immunity protein